MIQSINRLYGHALRGASAKPSTRRYYSSLLQIHPEIKQALHDGRPVVALESTIITHGMPFPQNLETATLVESIIRSQGAIPATIALINGKIRVGLESQLMEELSTMDSKRVSKVSRRDIAPILAYSKFNQGERPIYGSTTVSGTMLVAHMAGIKVFVTGGIGGVHRGAEQTFDISADLTELGRTPVAVVCAGAKSILDIPKTLEYLETQGVSVVSVGRSRAFPAFYTPDSGYQSPSHALDAVEAAHILHHHSQLELNSGILFAVPIPEAHAQESIVIQRAIQLALEESTARGIDGKDVTPFLLKRVGELTKGQSLKSNIALIENNARVGGEISVHYAKLKGQSSNSKFIPPATSSYLTPSHFDKLKTECLSQPPVFIGGAAMDIITKLSSATTGTPEKQQNWNEFMETSTPAEIQQSMGGVARNVAEACHRALTGITTDVTSPGDHVASDGLFSRVPLLISPIAQDEFGKTIEQQMKLIKMNFDGLCTDSSGTEGTAVYNAILDPSGRLIVAGADMKILSQPKLANIFDTDSMASILSSASLVCLDANLHPAVTREIVATSGGQTPIFYEPTSVPKSVIHFPVLVGQHSYESQNDLGRFDGPLAYCSPNREELEKMATVLPRLTAQDHESVSYLMKNSKMKIRRVVDDYRQHENDGYSINLLGMDEVSDTIADFKSLWPHLFSLSRYCPTVVLKLGKAGVLSCQRMHTHPLLDELAESDVIDTISSGQIFEGSFKSNDDFETAEMLLSDANLWTWSPPDPSSLNNHFRISYYPPSPDFFNGSKRIVSVNGAGDSCVGVIIAQIDRILCSIDRTIQERPSYYTGETDLSRILAELVFEEWSESERRLWHRLPMKNRHWMVFNRIANSRAMSSDPKNSPNNDWLWDYVMLSGRRAAELTLQTQQPVHPLIGQLLGTRADRVST